MGDKALDIMNIPLAEDEMLVLGGRRGTVAIVKVGADDQFFLETGDEEIVLGLEPHDLIVASSFSTGRLAENGLKCSLFLIREVRSPLIVLPKDHPASARLKIVLSAGNRTVLSCNISPGTHPNQDVLCGSGEFDGAEIIGTKEGVELRNLPECDVSRVNFKI